VSNFDRSRLAARTSYRRETVYFEGHRELLEECRSRIVRGGSWNSTPEYVRSAAHYGLTADIRVSSLGFRVGRTLDRR
jgi:formylglycine-generating enzyme required for sulfatase activity